MMILLKIFLMNFGFIELNDPFIPLMIFGFINDFGEKWMLQTWGGSEEQAYFGIAAQYASIALLATVSIIKPFWKEIAEANKKKDFKLVKKLYFNSTRLLFFVGLIVSIPLLPWANDILFIILGRILYGRINNVYDNVIISDSPINRSN